MTTPQIQRRYQTSYIAHVMASSAMGSNWGSSRTVWHLTHAYLHAQTAAEAGDICTLRTMFILITGKPKDSQFELHTGIKVARVPGSPLFNCGQHWPWVRHPNLILVWPWLYENPFFFSRNTTHVEFSYTQIFSFYLFSILPITSPPLSDLFACFLSYSWH